MKLKVLLFLFVLQSIYVVANARNSERILNFHSDIVIDTTGRVEITESITVYAGGANIERGIVRSIPLYRTNKHNVKINMDFIVLSVMRNGEEEPYFTKDYNDFRDIYIGDEFGFLEPGVYQYSIKYEAYGHIGFFDNFDEIYWNVTGNEWYFEIDSATASVTLPEGASFVNSACYIGLYGSTREDCSFQEQNGKYEFYAHDKLRMKEGFTIAIAFTPHVIRRPGTMDMYRNERPDIIYSGIVIIVLLCYYIFTLLIVKKRSRKKYVVPTFDPPNSWNAPTIRRFYKKKHDKKVLTVALIELAVRRLIRIRQEDEIFKNKTSQYILDKLATENTIMSSLETRIIKVLFPEKETALSVSEVNHARFYAADRIIDRYSPDYGSRTIINHHLGYYILGLLLTVLAAIPFLFLISLTKASIAVLGFIFIFFVLFILLIAHGIYTAKKTGSKICLGILGFALTIGYVLLQHITFIPSITPQHEGFILLLELLTVIHFCLLKTPVRSDMDTDIALQGFRMYLKTAEENRLNLLTPPEHTPELFEKLLPYAIAMDVENEWGSKFNRILKKANYAPDWYLEPDVSYSINFTGTFIHSFEEAIPDITIVPKEEINIYEEEKTEPQNSRSNTYSRSSDEDDYSSSGSSRNSGSGRSSGSSSWDSGTSSSDNSGSSSRKGHSGGGGGGGGGRGW